MMSSGLDIQMSDEYDSGDDPDYIVEEGEIVSGDESDNIPQSDNMPQSDMCLKESNEYYIKFISRFQELEDKHSIYKERIGGLKKRVIDLETINEDIENKYKIQMEQNILYEKEIKTLTDKFLELNVQKEHLTVQCKSYKDNWDNSKNKHKLYVDNNTNYFNILVIVIAMLVLACLYIKYFTIYYPSIFPWLFEKEHSLTSECFESDSIHDECLDSHSEHSHSENSHSENSHSDHSYSDHSHSEDYFSSYEYPFE